ncbi:glycosyltransferase family 2 protein [Gymnodinialimonas sp. 57CJ19]|uniref:glycosyltransferase n=1 Tax=Gymnodinialimonas sp. 57CJ19 TaxID=3138498 RepID=UPI0031343981
MTTLSILVPTYFHEAYLDSCVTSALSAKLAPHHRIEVLILDDGSTDGTPDVGKRLQRQHGDSVTYVWQENTGHIPRNLNTLAKLASGDLLMLFAGDDAFPEGWDASARIAHFEDDPELALSLCQGQVLNANGNLQDELRQPSDVMDALTRLPSTQILDEFLERQPFQLFLQAAIVRRDVYRDVGGYNETLAADDTAMALRLFRTMVAEGLTHRVDEDISFLYRKHSGNLHRNHLRALHTKIQFYVSEIAPEHRPRFAKKLLFNLEGLSWRVLWSHAVREMLHGALEPKLVHRLLIKASLRKIKR